VRTGTAPPPADLVILPGSKNVQADLAWLRSQGWEDALRRHLRYGGRVIGICGGMQMLGREVADPQGVESAPGSVAGLGWLDFSTTLTEAKTLKNVTGRLALGDPAPVKGYEIHMGETEGPALARPAMQLNVDEAETTALRPDGAISADGQIFATYLHGLFDTPEACSAMLAWAGLADARHLDYSALREASLDRLADTLAAHLDLPKLFGAIR
jgi:adenosylcobyric acid synthase